MIATARRRHLRFRPNLVLHVPLLVMALYALGPLVLLVLNAVKTDNDANSNPVGWPNSWNLDNFARAWSDGNLGQAMLNSIIVSGITIVGVCLVAGMGAFALAKLHLPAGGVIIAYFLGSTTVPPQLFVVPLFFLWERLHLTNSLLGLSIVYIATNTPFCLFLLRSYFVGLPAAIEDAARIDGASEMVVYWKIVVPLSMPVFFTVALITAVSTWNEFFYALVFLQSDSVQTVALSYQNFTQRFTTNLAEQNAAGLILILPIVVLYLLVQRRFVAGMTAGGLKL